MGATGSLNKTGIFGESIKKEFNYYGSIYYLRGVSEKYSLSQKFMYGLLYEVCASDTGEKIFEFLIPREKYGQPDIPSSVESIIIRTPIFIPDNGYIWNEVAKCIAKDKEVKYIENCCFEDVCETEERVGTAVRRLYSAKFLLEDKIRKEIERVSS